MTFNKEVDSLYKKIECFVDDFILKKDVDIDFICSGNVITLCFQNKTQIIINTQEPLSQVWIATQEQGYHFDFRDCDWHCKKTDENLFSVLRSALIKQSN